MKAMILAAGYATRLYPLTRNKPKPLLTLGGKPIINYLVEGLEKVPEINEIYVVTNQKFYEYFHEWARDYSCAKSLKVLNDGTSSNDDRLGAIGDMKYVIDTEGVEEDLVVIGGDNYFDFGAGEFLEWAMARPEGAGTIAVHDIGDLSMASQYGIVAVDENSKVLELLEKPEDPPSTLVAMALYYFTKEMVGLVNTYLEAGNVPDAPGYFISWLVHERPVYAYRSGGRWFDIGDLKSYEKADKELGGSGGEHIAGAS